MIQKILTFEFIGTFIFQLLLMGNWAQAQTKSCPDPRLFNIFRPTMENYNPVDLMVYGPPNSQSWCTLNPGLASPNRSPCSLHHVYLPNSVAQLRDTLFVFLPGTSMEPDKHDLVLSMAAYAGYRTIGLSYENRVNTHTLCDNSICGNNCHGNVREEAILGEDVSSLLNIEKADSILERLYALLVALHEEDIADGINHLGWNAYYVPLGGAPELSFDNIVWNKIIISGFSEGAGHAAKIAKETMVEGLIIIDGANDSCQNGIGEQPADWILDPGNASENRPHYGLRHAHGEIPPYGSSASWLALGLGISGVDDLDDGILNLPPSDAAFTAQPRVDKPDCTEHYSMARDQCMPTDPVNQRATKNTENLHVFAEYLLRLCFATGIATTP